MSLINNKLPTNQNFQEKVLQYKVSSYTYLVRVGIYLGSYNLLQFCRLVYFLFLQFFMSFSFLQCIYTRILWFLGSYLPPSVCLSVISIIFTQCTAQTTTAEVHRVNVCVQLYLQRRMQRSQLAINNRNGSLPVTW